ncbi:MAG: dimethylmenaquinone methyltransferase [Acidobacteria bacterium RIFCSPLOWO2_02_FULL_67_21]|nr:MAG: dimethylmenaquinone methyltransferase [Acidobacteria bacterium RIFCSPLOWO2_02_FULL_67_21]
MTSLPPSSHGKPVDTFPRAAELERELKRVVAGEVRFDPGSRALYASDGSNYRQIPIGLVVPRDDDDVVAAVELCRKYGAPVLPRGGGTSLAGQCCNVAVVLDFSKYMNRILELDPGARFARVQPGVVLDTLRDRAEHHRLTFAPDPSSHSRCTLGGMIGNNSCGTHSLLAGKTVDNIETLRVLLYDGTQLTVGRTSEPELDTIVRRGGRRGDIYARLRALRDRYAPLIRQRFPDIPRRVSGYNLDQLLPEQGFHVARALVGSEGTCAIVLEARATLIESPQHRSLVGLGYPDTFAAADHVMPILEHRPIGLEGFEGIMVDGLRRKGAPNLDLLPDGRGFLLVEFGAESDAEAAAAARRLVERLGRLPDAPAMRVYTATEAQAVWRIREAGPRAAISAPGMPPRYEGWDDSAVPPERLGRYLRDLRALLDEFHYQAAYYGHFGHGCIHMQVSFDLRSEPGIRRYAEFVDRAADLVVGHGGSISGEHGDGQSRGALLPKMFGDELMQGLREFKAIWDPAGRLNPGKLVDALPPTENLRLGADFRPDNPPTHFRFPDDEGSFAQASLRCIGIGECRKHDSGTMCPSYMATLEEEHSTRGRAHMLFEVLQGEVVADTWNNEYVKRSLDLCLSCKACKSECPANVDLATYRAEFLSHYYDTHARPLEAYAFGLVDRWARLGSMVPALANAAASAPGLSALIRRLLHLAPERELPRLAPVSFRRWARRQGVPSAGDVVLWADTFNNYFRPDTSIAAYDVLTAAGFRVSTPDRHLCCGRPLYDFGLLTRAKAYLTRVMDALAAPIDAGCPIVVLEPSCASVFRDELHNLFPDDPRAQKLRRQTVVLSEFFARHAPAFAPALRRTVLLHGHCHQKAIMKMDHEVALLGRMGADVQAPDAGCCGMAGPFGFAADKFAVSKAIGERVLLPAVRQAAEETLIVADGFSCREQIAQLTGRRAIHLAEAMRLAL